MENVSLKLDSSIARQIDLALKEFNYSTKTEFIRDAIRCKLKQLHDESEKKKALATIARFRGFLKGQEKFKTEEEWHDWKSNVLSKQLEEEFKKKEGII